MAQKKNFFPTVCVNDNQGINNEQWNYRINSLHPFTQALKFFTNKSDSQKTLKTVLTESGSGVISHVTVSWVSLSVSFGPSYSKCGLLSGLEASVVSHFPSTPTEHIILKCYTVDGRLLLLSCCSAAENIKNES